MLQKTDILFAHKALNLVAELSAADRRVAGAIIDHFNKKTGQCDPGNARLAELLQMDARTVRRATSDLCELYGLFSKNSHGGKSHRAAYTPNWEKFRAIVQEWDAGTRVKKGSSGEDDNRAEPPGSLGRNRPVEQGEIALQTYLSNLSNKPSSPSGASGDAGSAPEPVHQAPVPTSQRRGRYGLLRGSKQEGKTSVPNQSQVATFSPSHELAAREQALKRWGADLRSLGEAAHGDALECMTDDLIEATTLAEMKLRGGGVRHLLETIGPKLLRSVSVVGRRT